MWNWLKSLFSGPQRPAYQPNDTQPMRPVKGVDCALNGDPPAPQRYKQGGKWHYGDKPNKERRP